MTCYRCSKNKDLAILEINGEELCCCYDCRKTILSRKNPIGRPEIGITKEVSLTLEENDWDAFNELAGDNKSKFLRQVVIEEINHKSKESELYFKSEQHEKDYFSSEKRIFKYWDYLTPGRKSFLYLVTALGKTQTILDCFDTRIGEFDIEEIQKKIALFSSTERNIIRFAIQMLYNENRDDISLSEVMSYLDERNVEIMRQAINIRYFLR